eukprot:COSAG02_NODE_535_length_20660_cov_37.561111_6_plen_591_part_01
MWRALLSAALVLWLQMGARAQQCEVGLVPTSAATDRGDGVNGVNGFTELDGPTGVATFVVGGGTYAIVAAAGDDGIQIVDISDPSAPVAVGSATDGVGGFTHLDGAYSVSTFVVGGGTYAIVAATDDDGIQIVNISDPSAPAAVGSATDGVGGFAELDRPFDVSTFVVGGGTYAIVAANVDDGIQIVNISDPSAPVAVGSATDGVGGFTELDGACAVSTFVVGGGTYAIVAANVDDGIQIVNISDPSAPAAVGSATDGVGGFTVLYEPRAVSTFVMGGGTYAIVAALYDGGIQLVDVSVPSAPVAVGSATDGSVTDGVTVVNANTLYFFFSAVAWTSVFGAAPAGGVHNIIQTRGGAEIWSGAVIVWDNQNGVRGRRHPRGAATASQWAAGDVIIHQLDGAISVTTFVVDDSTYAIVAAEADDSIQIVDISDPSAPVAVGSATDGVGGFTELDGASAVSTFAIGGSTYAIVAARADSGIQLMRVGFCCNDFASEASVDACTECSGGGATECTSATCAPGFSTFIPSGGFCCNDFASEASVDACTECSGGGATECTSATCAPGFSTFIPSGGFCCNDFASEASVDACTECSG